MRKKSRCVLNCDPGRFVYENEHFLALLDRSSSGNRANKLSVQKQMVRVIQR